MDSLSRKPNKQPNNQCQTTPKITILNTQCPHSHTSVTETSPLLWSSDHLVVGQYTALLPPAVFQSNWRRKEKEDDQDQEEEEEEQQANGRRRRRRGVLRLYRWGEKAPPRIYLRTRNSDGQSQFSPQSVGARCASSTLEKFLVKRTWSLKDFAGSSCGWFGGWFFGEESLCSAR